MLAGFSLGKICNLWINPLHLATPGALA